MKNKLATFEEEALYHVYNRANGNESLYLSDDNYQYFLDKYEEYLSHFVDTFCYCLMPNHFHFLIKVKKQSEIEEKLKAKSKLESERDLPKVKSNLQGFQNLESEGDLPGFQNLAGLNEMNLQGFISRQFSNFFNAYAKAFNKQHNRKGSLFMHTYKRKRIDNEKYLRKLIHYIHYNPLEAGLVSEIEAWKYSSFSALISKRKNKLSRREVIELFENRSNFIYCHQTPPSLSGIEGDV